MIIEQTKPKRAWLATLGLLSFFIAALFSISYEVRKNGLEDEINELKSKKESLMKPAAEEAESANDVGGALFARAELQKIQSGQIPWSKIIEKTDGLIPKALDSEEPAVLIKSYTGNAEGKISLSGSTRPDAPDPFTDIAAAIQAFTSEPSFREVFVSSVARSITPDGENALTFSLTFEYQKPSL